MAQFEALARRRTQLQRLLAGLPMAPSTRSSLSALGYDLGQAAAAPKSQTPIGEFAPARLLERWVQAALTVILGVRLPLTGLWGESTRAALLQFQKSMGLAVHGHLDAATLKALEQAVGLPAPRDGSFAGPRPRWQDDHRKGGVTPNPAQLAARFLAAESSAALRALVPEPRWLAEQAAVQAKPLAEVRADVARQLATLESAAAPPSWWQQAQVQAATDLPGAAAAIRAALVARWPTQAAPEPATASSPAHRDRD
jgi:hypothetical protein